MGIYAIYENAIRIMVPRDLHLGDEEFDQLKIGESIRVEIQKSRFQLRDPFIVSVGLYRGRTGAAAAPPISKVLAQPAAVEPLAQPAAVEPVEEGEDEDEEEEAAESEAEEEETEE